ncbi:MAG: bifunctional hydroxymethylpyrimidine kinase/phosphomethylpyrimidine kinase [Janthinobacterium lividum]
MTARVVLSIAGSDPSGGAGIQADLKTFGALGVFGTSVLTALTAQNTRGVFGVHPVPAGFVARQLDVLLDDVEVHATKIGMLAGADIARVVVDVLSRCAVGPVVLDPVMVATSGDRLLDTEAVAVVRDDLLPLADLVTPNVPEAAVLLGVDPARGLPEMIEQAEELLRRSGTAVLLKGGHLDGVDSVDLDGVDSVDLDGADSVDVLATTEGTRLISRPRVATTATHGTGCTLSAAIAALAALRPVVQTGRDDVGWDDVVEDARDYLQGALAAGVDLGVGHGHGPVDHFHRQFPTRARRTTS